MRKSTPRKALKTKTPIVFGIPKAELERMKQLTRNHYKNVEAGTGNINDILNIAFRLKVGSELAAKVYTEVTQEEFSLAFESILAVVMRWVHEKTISPTAQEKVNIEEGMDAVDAMQMENIRRILLDAHLVARKYVYDLVRMYVPPEMVEGNLEHLKVKV